MKQKIKTNKKIYTVKEVAEYLNLNLYTILRYIHKDIINATRITEGKHGRFIITEEDLIKFIRRRRGLE